MTKYVPTRLSSDLARQGDAVVVARPRQRIDRRSRDLADRPLFRVVPAGEIDVELRGDVELRAEERRIADRLVFGVAVRCGRMGRGRSEEHTSELQSLMRISYAVF